MPHRVVNPEHQNLSGVSGQWTTVPVQMPPTGTTGENPDPFRFSGSGLSRPVSRLPACVHRRIHEACHFPAAQVAVLSRLEPGVFQESNLDPP